MRRISIITITTLLLAALALSVSAVYIHGFFRYTIDDGSVVITLYTGSEETVTVPAMIGGNPVNVIAAGAFAGNKHVKTVYLPDTIMRIEQGAFAEGQTVVYAGSADPDFKPGDINGDGSVNNKDVTALFRYVNGVDAVTVRAALDPNGDGSVNNKDVIALFRCVSGADVKLSDKPYKG